MSGTQDMIARILADAEAEGARIEEQARNKAGALLQEAGEQAEESKRLFLMKRICRCFCGCRKRPRGRARACCA